MQVQTQYRNVPKGYEQDLRASLKRVASQGMHKAAVFADLFNNETDGQEEKEKKSVKLRLTRTSQALVEELKEAVHTFLVQNKDITKLLDGVSLPENEYLVPLKETDLSLRKIRAYVNWLYMRGMVSHEKQELPAQGLTPAAELSAVEDTSNDPYLAIHEKGKDEEIKAIFAHHENRQVSIKDSRRRLVLNYYYLVYPETYAFN